MLAILSIYYSVLAIIVGFGLWKNRKPKMKQNRRIKVERLSKLGQLLCENGEIY